MFRALFWRGEVPVSSFEHGHNFFGGSAPPPRTAASSPTPKIPPASFSLRPTSLRIPYHSTLLSQIYILPPTPTQATMQACRRSLSSTSPLLHRNASCFPPRIPNNDLRVFLLPRFQSTAPSSIESALTNAINAPTATLPAPLELPKKESGMNTFMYLLKTGKGYVCVKKKPPPQFPSGIGSTLIYSN